MAAVGALFRIYTPSAQAEEAAGALSPSGPSSSFDYKKYAGATVTLQVSKHPYIDALKANVSKFTDLTGINVTFDMQPEALYFDKIKFGLAQKSSDFDVFMLGAYMTWQYGPAGWVEDLGPYIRDPGKTAPEFDFADIFPNVLANDSWDNKPGDKPGTGSAHQWALPWGWESYMLTYRRDILKKHGLAVPRSYPQILSVCQKLKTLEPKMIPFLSRGGLNWDTVHPGFLSGFSAFGGQDFDGQLRPTMNSQSSIEFTDLFTKLNRECGMPGGQWPSVGVFDLPHAVGNGDAVMYHDASVLGFFTDLPGGSKLGGQGKIAFAPSPGRDGPSDSNMWIWSLGLNAGSKQKDAAWLFMQWAAGKDHLLFAGTKFGHADTIRKSVFNNPAYQQRMADRAGYVPTFNAQAEKSRLMFTPQQEFFAVTDRWAGALQDVYAGRMTSEAALNRCVQRISQEIELRPAISG